MTTSTVPVSGTLHTRKLTRELTHIHAVIHSHTVTHSCACVCARTHVHAHTHIDEKWSLNQQIEET